MFTFAVAADGLALGAAAGLSTADVELIIFLAIMLHKAPAAFGFTSFLIHEVPIHSMCTVPYVGTVFFGWLVHDFGNKDCLHRTSQPLS